MAEEGEADDKPRFLIWSNVHGGWYRPWELGYTSRIEEAGRYSADQATRIVTRVTGDGRLWHAGTDPVTGREYRMYNAWPLLSPEGALIAIKERGDLCPGQISTDHTSGTSQSATANATDDQSR